MTAESDNNFGFDYDKEKYKEMLLDAAETVLWHFWILQNSLWEIEGQKMVDGIRKNKRKDVQAKLVGDESNQLNIVRIKQVR